MLVKPNFFSLGTPTGDRGKTRMPTRRPTWTTRGKARMPTRRPRRGQTHGTTRGQRTRGQTTGTTRGQTHGTTRGPRTTTRGATTGATRGQTTPTTRGRTHGTTRGQTTQRPTGTTPGPTTATRGAHKITVVRQSCALHSQPIRRQSRPTPRLPLTKPMTNPRATKLAAAHVQPTTTNADAFHQLQSADHRSQRQKAALVLRLVGSARKGWLERRGGG